MTQPTGPTDRKFARDVAKQIDRRRVRRRVTLWSALLALVAAAAGYLRCGSGLGLGGDGGRGGDGEHRPVAGQARCAIRVSASGFTVAGRVMSRDEAVAACKGAADIDIFVTGDARHGDALELRAALVAAGHKDPGVHEPPLPDGVPRDNPGETPGAAAAH